MHANHRQRPRYVLTMACRSARGQVAGVVAFLERHGAYIEEIAAFDDQPTTRFFLRVGFHGTADLHLGDEDLRRDFKPTAAQLGATEWRIHDLAQPTRVLLMVSRLGHCLQDLLAGWQRGELAMEPAAVVSNHEDMRPLAESYGLPYHYMPLTPETKHQQEQQLLKLVEAHEVELVVLARYMQVLSSGLCAQLRGRVINIHHSFLPGFKGARPYHQAFERGVKLIGATAHFATPDLDEGPIIDQAAERVDHAHGPEDLLNVGRRMECAVLSRALRDMLQHRVFINDQRTVVLR